MKNKTKKKANTKLENDDLFEIAAMLFKVQTKVAPDSFKRLKNPTTLVKEYMKIVNALKKAL